MIQVLVFSARHVTFNPHGYERMIKFYRYIAIPTK